MEKKKLVCLGKDEVYCNWYECDVCKSGDIKKGDKFCSHCGQDLKDKEFIEI